MQAKDDQRFNSKFSNRKALLAKAQLGICTLCDSDDKHKEGDCPVLLAANISQCWELVKLKRYVLVVCKRDISAASALVPLSAELILVRRGIISYYMPPQYHLAQNKILREFTVHYITHK